MPKPNVEKDKLILQKRINLKFDGMPAMNFKTAKVEIFSRLHYDVKLYQREDNSQYYVFQQRDNCTLFIMNCNKDVYDKLERLIPLNDDIDIFEYSESERETALEYVRIPLQYRHQKGVGIPTVLFYD